VAVQTLKREQARTRRRGAREAESPLANDGGEAVGSCCRRPRMSQPKGVWILYVPGAVYLGRTFESPELVFVRSLEVDA
jgi:hypothetical protein